MTDFARLTAEYATEGLVYFDRDANAVWVNRSAARTFGLTPGDLPRLASDERRTKLLAEDGSALPREAFAPVEAMRTGRPVRQVFGLPTGSWFDASVQPILDAAGTVEGAVMSVADVTAQREARTELAKTEAMLSSVFAAMQEGVVVQGRDGAIIHANAAAERILGLSADQMAGRTSMDPRWRAEHEDGSPFPGETHPAMEALATGTSIRETFMAVHRPDGSKALIEINAEPLWSSGQGASHVVATFLDVTARKAAEADLRTLAARVSDLYNNAPCAYHSLDSHGRYVEINDTELAWLGATRDAVIGRMSPADFMTEASRVTFADQFPRIRDGEGRREIEVDFIRPEGGTRRVSLTASVATDADGRFVMTRTVMYDISELHLLRTTLERHTLELESMLDNEMVAIARLRDRRFLWVNRAASTLFGRPPQELVGTSTRMLYQDEATFLAIGESFEAQMQAGGIYRGQAEFVDGHGQIRWVDIYGAYIEGTGETLAFYTDLTPIRRAEARLMQSQRLESVGRLAGGVAHEFNNKLQTVLGITELALLDAGVSEQLARDLREIQVAARHAAGVARQLMAYAGRQHQAPQILDLRDTVRARLPLLTPLLPLEVELALDGGPDVWPVRIDGAQVTEILANLVMNAVEAMHTRGRVALQLRNVVVDPARAAGQVDGRTGDFVELTVRDTGTGMPPDVLARACEPFFTTKRFGQNSGLGLSTVYGIVQQNGGWLELTSELGVGTTVAVLLPRRTDAGASPLH